MKKKIPEQRYRASRICRVLGNPTAYETLHVLEKGRQTPSQLAHKLGLSITTISAVLRTLRDLDLVRYEIKWRQRHYWLKTGQITTSMRQLEQVVKTIESMR
ncbi:MAG: winged helix-turn-helix transcriptional regulator [candidate division WOR-3 bacterium]|nr:MAG: winged helix-turn-helix transcriptional regulator [candidate division WOR-3 bacterium]